MAGGTHLRPQRAHAVAARRGRVLTQSHGHTGTPPARTPPPRPAAPATERTGPSSQGLPLRSNSDVALRSANALVAQPRMSNHLLRHIDREVRSSSGSTEPLAVEQALGLQQAGAGKHAQPRGLQCCLLGKDESNFETAQPLRPGSSIHATCTGSGDAVHLGPRRPAGGSLRPGGLRWRRRCR